MSKPVHQYYVRIPVHAELVQGNSMSDLSHWEPASILVGPANSIKALRRMALAAFWEHVEPFTQVAEGSQGPRWY